MKIDISTNRKEVHYMAQLAETMEETPTFGDMLNTDYILGMVKMEGGVKILLDIDRVLSANEISLLEQAA